MRMNLSIAPPPDPLRRFMETPHCVTIGKDAYEWTVSSNDPSVLDVIRNVARSCEVTADLHWMIIREADVADRSGAIQTLMHAPGCAVATIGDACVIAIDCEQEKAYGFVGQNVPVALFQQLCTQALLTAANKHTAGESK